MAEEIKDENLEEEKTDTPETDDNQSSVEEVDNTQPTDTPNDQVYTQMEQRISSLEQRLQSLETPQPVQQESVNENSNDEKEETEESDSEVDSLDSIQKMLDL